MRQGRTPLILMFAVGVFGALMGVCAQERRTPWPSAPIAAGASTIVSATMVPPSPAKPAAAVDDTSALVPPPPVIDVPATATPDASVPSIPRKVPAEVPATPTIEVSATAPPETSAPNRPSKLPAEVPGLSDKVVFQAPELLAPPKRRLPESGTTPKVPVSPTAIDSAPSVPQAPPPAIPPSAAPRVPEPPPLPMFVDPKPSEVQPLPIPEAHKVESPPAKKDTPSPGGSVNTKPLTPAPAPAIPMTPRPSPEPTTPAVPLPAPVPEVIVAPAPVPLTPPPTPAPAPSPATTSPMNEPVPPSRPPAFLLVKPRRVEATPAPVAPAPPPAALEPPRAQAAPLAASSAHVTIEKRGPAMVRQGTSAHYDIIVRNRGAVASGPVTVIAEIPSAARLVAGDPVPALMGDKALWTLPPLPANSETLLKLELLAVGSGEMIGNTTVYVASGTATTRTTLQADPGAGPVVAGPLDMQIRAPGGGAVGQPVVFEVTVTNHSTRVMNDLVLFAKLGAGLTHPAGAEIEADVGELAPGKSRVFKIPTTATRQGRHSLEVKITAAGGAEARAQASVPINGSGLSLQLGPTSRLTLDREGELRIHVTNHQNQSLRNVVVADTLPEQLQFLGASDRGIYQASTRTVQWLIDMLPAGETRSVVVRVQGKALGQFAKEMSVRAEAVPPVTAQTLVQVEGRADLVLKLTPREPTLEAGRETVCEVRVQNPGTLPATGLRLQIELPPGLVAGHVQGPTGHRTLGRTVVFEPIAKLPAGMQAVYHLGVTARSPGDWRVRAQLSSDQAPARLTREIALQAYRE